jgi:methylmalonyl-CoA/ethylmalonyl-CoA epimerase
VTVQYFGEDAVFHHLGIAVSSLNKIVDVEHPRWDDDVQGVRVAFVDLSGAPVELIEPLSALSPVSKALSIGRPLVHVCFEVPSLAKAISAAEQHDFHLLRVPTPAVAFEGRRIAWMYSGTWGLVELLERPEGAMAPCASEPARRGEDYHGRS